MALPIAQLGYMPSLSTPSGGGHYDNTNPWQKLAMQVLAGVAQQGIQNEMSPDFTSQAQNEGLPVDPTAKDASFLQKFLSGPTTNRDQMDRLRGNQSQQNLARTSESGQNKRSEATLGNQKELALAKIAADKENLGKTLTSEEARALAAIRSHEYVAGQGNASNERIAGDANSTRLTTERMGNDASTRNAQIMAGSPTNQANLMRAYQLLQQGARANSAFPSPDGTSPSGMTPEDLAALQDFMKRFPQLAPR